LLSNDVPVAALILFRGSIIGRGFNTAEGSGDAGGHAEINALSNAMRTIGVQQFKDLDRDSLILITTFEPCPMCRGAILQYGLRNVIFLKPKPMSHLLLEDLRALRYQWRRMQKEPRSLQDSLFYSHPGYRRSMQTQ